ncbi:MAG: hypothetical protein ABJF27_15150 [Crocinitomicaceae bacterium]
MKIRLDKFLTVGIMILLFFGCDMNESSSNNKTNSNDSYFKKENFNTSIKNLQVSIVNDGDTSSYKDYSSMMFESEHTERFLYWAIIMANKFEYVPAHLDVFNCILESYVCGDISRLNEIDQRTFELMNYHLLKASELEEAQVIQEVIDSIGYNGNSDYNGCSKYTDGSEIQTLKGDTNAYKKVYIESTELDFPPSRFLFWAIFMSNRYHYPLAYGHVYESLLDPTYFEGDLYLDEKTHDLALDYLEKFDSLSPNVKDYYRGLSWMDFEKKNLGNN